MNKIEKFVTGLVFLGAKDIRYDFIICSNEKTKTLLKKITKKYKNEFYIYTYDETCDVIEYAPYDQLENILIESLCKVLVFTHHSDKVFKLLKTRMGHKSMLRNKVLKILDEQKLMFTHRVHHTPEVEEVYKNIENIISFLK